MGVPKTSDLIKINIRMPNPSHEPPVFSESPNQDLKDMGVLCTFKIKIESQNSDHGCIKDQWPYPNQEQDAKLESGNSSILQSPKWGLNGHECSMHLQNQDREPQFGICVFQRQRTISKSMSGAKPKSGASSVLQSPKWGLKGHGCSLHLQTHDRAQKFGSWVYQRPVTISKSISGCQTPVRNLQHPPKPLMRT